MSARPIDKRAWGEGPWQHEPDRVEFEHAGFRCLLLRGPTHGAWCGYVGVPEGHPWHGVDEDAIDASAHGGLSYAAPCAHDVGICHVPAPGEPDALYWVGFDCIHGGDHGPGYTRGERTWETYRDLAYVRGECESLAEQARDAARGPNADARLSGADLGVR